MTEARRTTPPSGPLADSLNLGVVGCGTMGRGIAQVAAAAGARVRVHDADAEAVGSVIERMRASLARAAERDGLRGSEADARIDEVVSRVDPVASLQEVAASSELTIEAVVEDLSVKQAVFRELDEASPSTAILASNTSALSVGDIASSTADPGRVVGLHFFNPVTSMPLVEVVSAVSTRPTTTSTATAVVASWGKRPIQCLDHPGFIVNRVNRAFTLEALSMLEHGLGDIETIDAGIRARGFPLGPFELMDLIGIDVNLAVAEALHEAAIRRGDELADRFRPSEIQRQMVAMGRLGRKSGEGFYAYPRAFRPVDPAEAVPAEDSDPIILAIVLEAYRAADDGIAARVDIDEAVRLGAGHPLGPFEHARAIGPTRLMEAVAALAYRGPRFAIPDGLAHEAASISQSL